MSFTGKFVQRTWHLVDASSQTVGRLSTTVASLLKGKHKPTFSPNTDCGDVVVIVNAEKVQFTGRKWDDKLYRWHTGYPGGLKQRTAKQMREKHPDRILRKAILGMLPRNNLRHGYIEPRLKIFNGPAHPHIAQLPEGTVPLAKHPRANNGSYHFGLSDGKAYAKEGVYQEGVYRQTSVE